MRAGKPTVLTVRMTARHILQTIKVFHGKPTEKSFQRYDLRNNISLSCIVITERRIHMIFLTQTNVIRSLTKDEYALLGEMCHYSNNLYNAALYNIWQHYFDTKQFLRYESNYHKCKKNENYALLQAGISQQILKAADRSFKSFFSLIKKAKQSDYRFCDIEIPHYRKKG